MAEKTFLEKAADVVENIIHPHAAESKAPDIDKEKVAAVEAEVKAEKEAKKPAKKEAKAKKPAKETSSIVTSDYARHPKFDKFKSIQGAE